MWSHISRVGQLSRYVCPNIVDSTFGSTDSFSGWRLIGTVVEVLVVEVLVVEVLVVEVLVVEVLVVATAVDAALVVATAVDAATELS